MSDEIHHYNCVNREWVHTEDCPGCEIDRLRAEVEKCRRLDRIMAHVRIPKEQIDAAWIIAEKPVEKLILKKLGIVECSECGGSGIPTPYEVGSGESCQRCHGHGWIREERGDE